MLALLVLLQASVGLQHLATCGALEIVHCLYVVLHLSFLVEGQNTFLTSKHVHQLCVSLKELSSCHHQLVLALENMLALPVDFK